MRLTKSEKKIIHDTAMEMFGPRTKIFLYGSRADDSSKGGDIDLYVEAERNVDLDDKINFVARLKWLLGDQKIDVILQGTGRIEKPIHRKAKETGVPI